MNALFDHLLKHLAHAGLTARGISVEDRQLRIGPFDGYPPELSVWAFPAGTKRAFATVGPLSWYYRSPADGSANVAITLCKQVIAALSSEAAKILTELERPKALPLAPQRGQTDFLFAYRSDVEALRTGDWIDYPTCVNIETIAVCPAKCSFCTYPSLERIGQRMSDELLDKVLGDLEAIPTSQPFILYPFLINEPFAEKRLDAILARAEERLPHAGIDLITTGTLLDVTRIERLRERRNVRELAISLNFDNAAEYEAEMKLPWARTFANVRALHAAALDGKLPFRVVISRVGSDDHRDAHFSAFVAEQFPSFELRQLTRHNWLGHLPTPARPLDDHPCTQWFELKVAVTGKIALCCQDSHVEHAIGDATTMSLLDIYNLPEARARRVNLPARKTIDACRGCGFSRY